MFYIGISLENDVFRVAVLKKEKQALTVESLHSFPYGPDNVKLFYNLPPFHTGKEILVASGLPHCDTFIRKLHIPLKDQKKILTALPFQLESLLPYSEEAPVICPLFSPLSQQMTSVTIIATTSENLLARLAALKNLDITPDSMSCAPTALMRFGRWLFSEESRVLHFDVRDEKISCVVYDGKEIILSQTLYGEIVPQLEKLDIFLKQKGAIDEKTPWILTGEYTFTEQISKIFPGKMLQLNDLNLAAFATAIGYALDVLHSDEATVQFCQKKFTPEHTLMSRKKKALTYLSFCFGSALLMAICGSLMLGKKQSILIDRLQGYLPANLANSSLASVEEIEEKISEWEGTLSGPKNSFAYVPNVPKICDVLAWLSSHPAFSTDDGGQKEGIDIKSLHYTFTKYPKIGEASSPYIAHLDLEFTSETPRAARDFHEALLKGDQIVNAKKDIKWQTQNQIYHTSFELSKGAPQ